MAAPARATMDFFAAQAAARRRTAVLVLYFSLAVAGTIATVWAGLSLVLLLEGALAQHAFGPDLGAVVGALVGATTISGYAWHATRLADGGHAVARMLGGVPVDRRAELGGERRLVNVAEEMAIAAGLPVPALYVLPGESGINALAAGLAPDQAVVAVTRGALDRLSRDELQGVVAHEYSHVLNGDARLNLRLLAAIGGLTSVAAVGRVLLRAGSDSGRSGLRSRRRDGNGTIWVVGLVVWLAGAIGAFFGRLIRAAVSRQREYLADAAAVQFTRNPDGLALALAKIARSGSGVGSAFAPEAAHLFFANGLASRWLSTHPPLKDRIERILPRGYLRAMRLAEEAPAIPSEEPAAAEATRAEAPALVPPGLAAIPAPPLTPSAVVASAGRLDARHVAHAAGLLRALPPLLVEAARDPVRAAALVRALLADGAPAARSAQLARLADVALRAEVDALAGALSTIPRDARTAVLDLALPALDALSADAAERLEADLAALAAADGRTTIVEWAVVRIVRRRRARREAPARPARLRLDDVQVEVLDLLSAMAWAGTNGDAGAQAGLDTAVPVLGIPVGWRVLPRDRVTARRLDAALDRLDDAVPPLKARLVEACAAAVLFDGRVLPAEGELLRAIAGSLGVPVPPFLAQPEGAGRAAGVG